MGSRIKNWELFRVAPRWLFLRLETEDGLVGWGEPIVEGKTTETEVAVSEMLTKLGKWDTSRIEDAWQLLYRGGFYRGGPILSSALSGIDQALWDIRGKALGVPTHELLGGRVRDRIRAYKWVGGDNVEDLEQGLHSAIDSGYSAVKMNGTGKIRPLEPPATIDRLLANATMAREILGPTRDFAIDFHGRFSPALAKIAISELESYRPMFVEEPIAPELAAANLRGLVDSTPVPIALGERVYSRWEFLPLLQSGLAVAQPDVSHAGGISEVLRIASLTETFGSLLAPHCPLGPIALAASLQVDAISSNFLIQEHSIGLHYNKGSDLLDYLVDTSVFDVKDGHIDVPEAPGLGITVDEKAVRAAAKVGHNWQSPNWRNDDGSFAEW
jgi:galactonate dehydratase